jgi:hypothetical protein
LKLGIIFSSIIFLHFSSVNFFSVPLPVVILTNLKFLLKTINKPLKETGKQNTKRKEKLAKDEHDEDVAKVAQSDVQDVAIETSRKAVKKSAFTKFVSEHLGKVKTDVDSKVNKELAKINKIEPTDEEILAVAKAPNKTKTKCTRRRIISIH